MQSETGKLSVKEKIGYTLGDGAANFIFQTIVLLQLSFCTYIKTVLKASYKTGRPVISGLFRNVFLSVFY